MKIYIVVILFILTTSTHALSYVVGDTVVKFVQPDAQTTNPAQSLIGMTTPTFDPSTGYYSSNYITKTVIDSFTYWGKSQPYATFYHCFNNNGSAVWRTSTINYASTYTAHTEFVTFANSFTKVSSAPSANECSIPDPCLSKKDQTNYNLNFHSDGSPSNLSDSCYENCKTTAEELWQDCLNGQCVSSIKHTFTGEHCSGQPAITDLEPNQPNRCDDEINAKISACGGSLNIQSFNFETCTGQCTPDSCSDAYALKVQSCGGVMAVASWDETTCKGTCVSDPIPQEPGPTDKPPVEIERKEVVNSDGSKEVSRTTTQYNSETNTTYTTTTTTTYNSTGDQTNQTSSTTISPGKPDSQDQGQEEPKETFGSIGISGFGESYAPGSEYDIPTRFNTFLNTVKSSGLFSFSSSFFNSLPGGGSPVFTINGGQTFGSHSIDFSETMTTGLAVLKSILMACFGFLSIRAIIMKR